MKIIGVTFSVLCLLMVSCRNETPTNQTNTTTTTNTTTETPSLTVEFSGIVVFALSNGVQRAAVLRVPHHPLQIAFPIEMKPELERVFNRLKCDKKCFVPLDGRAFRIVDANDNPPTAGFKSTRRFSSIVTHLRDLPYVGDAFNNENMDADLFCEPKKGKFVAGFFELAGGDGDVTPFNCTAHYGGDKKTSRPFPKVVTVRFDLSPGAKLQVKEAGMGWVNLVTLTKFAKPTLIVDNNLKDTMSHFGGYAFLSKKNRVKVPTIELDDPNCKEPKSDRGDVPGCSDTQWP